MVYASRECNNAFMIVYFLYSIMVGVDVDIF